MNTTTSFQTAAVFTLLFVSGWASSEPLKTVFNPFTGKLDYITKIDSNTVIGTSGCTSTSNSNGTVNITCPSGSGGSSALGVNYNGVPITTPTAQINFLGAGVSVAAAGSTATVTINGGAPTSGSANYWNYPSTGTFVDTQGAFFSTMTTTGQIFSGSGAAATGRTEKIIVDNGDIALGFNTFTPDNRLYWYGFSNSTLSSIGYSNSVPSGLQLYDGVGNKLVGTMDNDSSGITKKGFVIRNGGALRFYDSVNNSGVHFTSLKSSATQSSNLEYTLPSVGGGEGQVFTLHADSSTYWATPSAGTVTSVTGTPPINSSGGTTPAISLSQTIGQSETITGSSLTVAGVNGLVVTGATTGPLVIISTAPNGIAAVSVSSTLAAAPSDFVTTISSQNGTPVFGVQYDGHIVSSGTTPSMGTCGTSPSVMGTDSAGVITIGGGVVTSCTMNFANVWANPPVCVESDNSTAVTGDITTTTTSSITFGFSSTLGGGILNFICMGQKG